jgi:hypothetical protein
MTKLKDCPFCGCEANIIIESQTDGNCKMAVQCKICYVTTCGRVLKEIDDVKYWAKEVQQEWNKRV